MKLTLSEQLTQFSQLLQRELFPLLEAAVGPLSKPGQLLVAVVSMVPLARWVSQQRAGTGRPACDRLCLATAFFAKAVYNLPSTRHLIERLRSDRQLRRLCGWQRAAQVPTEATFSRAFTEFAQGELATQMHAALVQQLQLEQSIEYLARDSTAIEARQRLPKEQPKAALATPPRVHPPYKTKDGWHQRQPRGKKKPPKRAKASERGSRLQRQQHMTLPEMLADLPRECSLGVKTSSQGHQRYWRGFKLHWDVADCAAFPSAVFSPAPACTIRKWPSRSCG